VIPNGAAASEFLAPVNSDIRSELGIPADHFLIVHVGSHTGWKGHAAAQQMFERANLPHSTLLIIGNSFSDSGGCAQACHQAVANWSQTRAFSERDQRLLVLELSREQTVAALRSAQLFLFPSNIECSPLVLFEAMASHLPFLTTAVGNAAEIIDWSGGGELLPTRNRVYINDNRLKFIVKSIIIYCQSYWRGRRPKTTYSEALIRPSVRQLESLYRDPERRERLAQQGFAAWQEKFTWEKIAQEYEKIYNSK
jgi:glycosyltransferase involved in cell wall biosynthesis